MLKQKTIEIKDKKIDLVQFNVLEVLSIRKEIVSFVRKQLPSSEELNIKTAISLLLSTVYEMPQEIILKLFKNCSCGEIGGLNTETNINKAFESNPDGILQLVMEVLDFNDFFTMTTLDTIVEKIPMLKPLKEALQKTKEQLKKN